MSERLQKVLAMQGLGSRREMERWIEQGFIKINGKLAEIGQKVSSQDRIHVKGRLIKNPLKASHTTKVLMYHKPVGEICTKNDPEKRKTVFDAVPLLNRGRWIMVGRLDINTSGLLLFTNNGELANQLMHPRYQFEREYAVRVFGKVDKVICQQLLKGVELDDGMARFTSLSAQGGDGANTWYHVTLNEGRNREIRRLWESQGVEVSRLCRVRYGNVLMPKQLRRGAHRYLDDDELKRLLSMVEKNTL